MRTDCILVFLTLLAAPSHHAQGGFEKVRQSLSHGQYAEAAQKLQRMALAGPSLKRVTPTEERMLRGAIATMRKSLANGSPEHRDDARQVLCLSRAYFPNEDLPGIEDALRVGGRVRPPVLIGKPVRPPYPSKARKAGIQGIVVVESIIDQEGCVRYSKVLKGLPFEMDRVALTVVQSWTYQPATLEDRPVAVHFVVTVPFSLKDR